MQTRRFSNLLVCIGIAPIASLFAAAQPATAPGLATPGLATPGLAPGGPAADMYRIAGTVVNAATGTPVQRALVEIFASQDGRVVASAITDRDGRFAFARLAAGKYPLTASKRGYRTAFYNEHDDFNTAIVTGPDQDTEQLIFLLSPGAEVHGTVTGDGGDPVEGARVLLFPRNKRNGPNGHAQLAGSTLTDDTGAYELGNQAPGEYAIAVIAQPWYAMHKAGGAADEKSALLDVAYPVTYFDSTTEEASAATIVLSAGSREEANINLHAVPALRISAPLGRRADGNLARPELRQYVFGLDVGAESAGFLNELKTGLVEFNGVAPGHYELTEGDPARIVELDATSSEQIDPNAGTPSVAVAGRLQAAGGAAAPRQARLSLTPINRTRGHNEMATAGADGRFTFESVAAGTWSLSAGSDGQMLPVRSIGSAAGLHEGNLLAVGDRPLEIVATTSRGVTRIEGFARKNGKGLGGVLVMLVPRDTAEIDVLSRRDQSDSDGSFALGQVLPGKYTLVAIEGGWDLNLSDPAVLARYLPRGTPVLVSDASGEVMHPAAPVTVQPR